MPHLQRQLFVTSALTLRLQHVHRSVCRTNASCSLSTRNESFEPSYFFCWRTHLFSHSKPNWDVKPVLLNGILSDNRGQALFWETCLGRESSHILIFVFFTFFPPLTIQRGTSKSPSNLRSVQGEICWSSWWECCQLEAPEVVYAEFHTRTTEHLRTPNNIGLRARSAD